MFLSVSVTLNGMDKESKARAGEAVAQAMADHGWDATDLARKADIPDAETIRKLVKVGTWPRPATREKIELALGWAPGDMHRAARGELDGEGVRRSGDPVEAAIEGTELSRGQKARLLSLYFDMIDGKETTG